MASSRRIPVVVSSHPPMTLGINSLYSVCIMFTRSPPSSMMMFGPTSMTFLIPRKYSSSVAPWTANTFSPSCTSAAAMSSCVESGLLPVIYISAPPSANISHRCAVFASRCTDNAIFLPLNGLLSLNSFSSPARSGMCLLTHSIFSSPSLQSSGFLISLVISYSCFLNQYNVRKNPITFSNVPDFFFYPLFT